MSLQRLLAVVLGVLAPGALALSLALAASPGAPPPAPGLAPAQTPTPSAQLFVPLFLRGVAIPPPPPAPLSGQVVDATNARPLGDVVISIVGAGLSTTSDATGIFNFVAVPEGPHRITASLTDYVTAGQDIDVRRGAPNTVNFALSPVQDEGEMRIVLEWGAQPEDLDSHLWLPDSQPYHIYWDGFYGRLDAFPFARLDIDDIDRYGPETITIRQRIPGRYVYAVFNYTQDAPLSGSNARVTVYRGAAVLASFTAPSRGEGRWWKVFEMRGDTGDLTPVNVISRECPATYSCLDAVMSRRP